MSTIAETVAKARLLVGGLGERAASPWWRSQATAPAGRRFLGLLFPRTALVASVETAGQAARIEHDARIGRQGVYHLFRLPVAEEAAVHDFLRRPGAAVALAPLADLPDQPARLAALRQLARAMPPVDGVGPVYCGPARDLRDGRALRRLCATYLAAFEDGPPRYPYLEDRPS